MSLEGEPRGPVGVGPVRPRGLPPPGVHEIDRFRHVFVSKHLAEDREDFRLGQLVRLSLQHPRLIRHHGGHENAAARVELWEIQRLKNGIVATFLVGVEQIFVGLIPKDLVGWKLNENFGVNSHLERLNRDFLPPR